MRKFWHVSLALLSGSLLAAQVAEIPFDSAATVLKLPANLHLGEAAGVATNSKGNILVYTRTGEDATMGGSRFFTHGGSRLFEFDSTGKYLREVGAGIYGFYFPPDQPTILENLHPSIWWGAIMLALGLFYTFKFRPKS